MKKILIITLAFCFSIAGYSQSKTVEAFESNSEGYKLFLYQSMIRVLNRDKNPDFNNLIRDLDHLRFVTNSKRKSEDAKSVFLELDSEIQDEGLEAIITFSNPDYKMNLYETETRKGKSHWIATFMVEGRAGVMEMLGSLNLKHLDAFSSLNWQRVEEMMNLDPSDFEIEVD